MGRAYRDRRAVGDQVEFAEQLECVLTDFRNLSGSRGVHVIKVILTEIPRLQPLRHVRVLIHNRPFAEE